MEWKTETERNEIVATYGERNHLFPPGESFPPYAISYFTGNEKVGEKGLCYTHVHLSRNTYKTKKSLFSFCFHVTEHILSLPSLLSRQFGEEAKRVGRDRIHVSGDFTTCTPTGKSIRGSMSHVQRIWWNLFQHRSQGTTAGSIANIHQIWWNASIDRKERNSNAQKHQDHAVRHEYLCQ